MRLLPSPVYFPPRWCAKLLVGTSLLTVGWAPRPALRAALPIVEPALLVAGVPNVALPGALPPPSAETSVPSLPETDGPLPTLDEAVAAPATALIAPSLSPEEGGPTSAPTTPTFVATAPERRFRYGFRLTVSGVYDDNVLLSRRDKRADFYFTIEPGLTLGLGDILERRTNYLRLDYAPSAYLFTEQTRANTLQHLIRLEGQYSFGRLTVSGSQDVQILDGGDLNVTTDTGTTVNRVNLDVSGPTRLDVYVTRVVFNYDLSGKSALALALLYNENDYQSARLFGSQTTSADFSYSYLYSPKLSLALAVAGGFLSAEGPNLDQIYEQVNVRTMYRSTGKVAITSSLGLEVRQSQGGSTNRVTPVLELGVLYQPFENTTATLSANRRVLSSATLAGQDYTTTGFTLDLRQRFLNRYAAGLTLGYEHTSYFVVNAVAVNPNAASDNFRVADAAREDNFFYVQPAVDVRITERLSARLFYAHRQNVSSLRNTGFADNHFGLRLIFSY